MVPTPLNSVWPVVSPCAWRDCVHVHSCVSAAAVAVVTPSHNSVTMTTNFSSNLNDKTTEQHKYMSINSGYYVTLSSTVP